MKCATIPIAIFVLISCYRIVSTSVWTRECSLVQPTCMARTFEQELRWVKSGGLRRERRCREQR
jgi:hypothetical protein